MIHILVANPNREEGNHWRIQLIKSGYKVAPECLNLSDFVYALAREKVHFVMCSLNLIRENAFVILNAVMNFFPRVKVIIVGSMGYALESKILSQLTGVVIRNTFGTDLEHYWEIPADIVTDEKKRARQHLSLLLEEHFLTYDEAALLLRRAMPKWEPDYVVMSIVMDSCFNQAYEAVTETLREIGRGFALPFRLGEVCVIVDHSPDEEVCFGIADSIRRALLTKTDASFSIGISRERSEAAELYVCKKEASRAASTPYLYGRDSVVHIDYLCENDIEYIYPAHKEKRLVEQTMDGNKQEALRMLDEIFQVLKRQKFLPQGLINKYALGIMVKLNIAALARAKIFEKIQMDSMSFGKYLTAKTTDAVYLFLKNGIQDFADEMDAFTDIRRDILYLRLSELKAEQADISVSDLVRTFHTTIGFLNSAVAHNTGGNIFDFFLNANERPGETV